MHTYIYPVLTYCKKCTPIPAPAFAGILSKLCTPICTQTPPAFCRQPSRFERLCPDFVASIGAHFFFAFSFLHSSAALCAAICVHLMSGGICYSCRHLLRCALFVSFSVFRRRLRVTICIHILSGYLQQCFKLMCTLFMSLFIFRRRLRGTICIHILSGYLQQRFKLRCTFFLFLFFLLCYIFQHTRHTEPVRAPIPPFFAFLFVLLVFYTPEYF